MRRLFLFLLFCLVSAHSLGANPLPKPEDKIAREFRNRNSNEDLNIIVRFRKGSTALTRAAAKQRVRALVRSKAGRVLAAFERVPVDSYSVKARELLLLAGDPEVESIVPDRAVKASQSGGGDSEYDFGLTAIRRNLLSPLGLDGKGVGVAVIDSGISQPAAGDFACGANAPACGPATASRVVYQENFSRDASNATNPSDVLDGYGHGTHVAGIIGGNGAGSVVGGVARFPGVAPMVRLVNLRVLNGQGQGYGFRRDPGH